MGVGADLGKFLSTEWLFKLPFFFNDCFKKSFEIQTEFDYLHVICCKHFWLHIEKVLKERSFVTGEKQQQQQKTSPASSALSFQLF